MNDDESQRGYIFGDKNIFAIEADQKYQSSDDWVKFRFWIQGQPIGKMFDSDSPGVILANLKFRTTEEGRPVNCECFSSVIDNVDINSKKYSPHLLFICAESFDDYIIMCCMSEDVLKFSWRVVDSPYFEYEESDFEVKHGVVSYSYFISVVEQFERTF